MSFAAPLWLLLLGLLPVVVLLHLIVVRWRNAAVSSLVLWNEVLRQSVTRLRIRRLLSSLTLVLELAAVAALALALAGPLLPRRGPSGAGDVILVLDATASMRTREPGGRTRFDIARGRCLDLVAGMRRGGRMAVILAARAPRLAVPFTDDRAALRRALQAAAATDEPGDLADSMALALSLRDARRGDTVALETDGAFQTLRSVDASLPWIRVDVVGTAQENVGITEMSFRRSPGSGTSYELFLAARNAGRSARTVPLTVRAAGAVVLSRMLHLAAGERATLSVPWNGPTAGRIEARLRSDDAFPVDDSAYAVFLPARRLSIGVVGPDAYFAVKALESLPGVTVRENAPQVPGQSDDVVVYSGVQPPPLEKGNFLLFAAVPPNLPLRVTGQLRVPPVTGWSRSDPLLKSVSLTGVTIGQALDLDPGPGFTVLAASGTSPLLLSWDHAGLKALIAAFPPGSSDFPLRPGFPILLANALSWFFPSWLQAHADQTQAGVVRRLGVQEAGPLVVVKPDGRRESLHAEGSSVAYTGTDEAGFYRVESRGDTREFAVNLASDAETDVTPRFAPVPSAGPTAAPAQAAMPAQVWWALGAAALALLLAELLAWAWARRRGEALSPRRTGTFLALRAAGLALLVLGLAGFGLTRFTDRLSLVFLIDQSRSVTPAQRAAGLRVVEAIRGKLRRGDSTALVRFGADAVTDDMTDGLPIPEDGAAVAADATDIGAALQAGLARPGGQGARRMVLLTDGNENRGDAERAAGAAKSLGARVFPVPLADERTGPEVSVEEVRAPARVRQGEAHEVTVMLRSRTGTRARVTLLRDALPVATREEALAPGENAVPFSGSFPERGLHAWDALVDVRGDSVARNNHGRLLVAVSGAPQVLYASKPGKGSPSLLAALAAQGIAVARRDPPALPGTLAGYLPYDALILDNVPGYGISTEKMETIARYVRDAGGGLLMTGGDSSFGAGGYYKTPIERVLPVDMDAKSQLQLPGLSLALVLDKSGSMGAQVPSGETKLDVVKSAAMAAIEALNPFDKVGVLAFDADWAWAVPLSAAGDTARIAADLAALAPGGGTVLFPALQEAERVLSSSPSPLRHVILLTDGLTDTADFRALIEKMVRERITVSTVAVGEDADADLLAGMARWGGGRTYSTIDPRDVPRIFLTDTLLASRGLLVEKDFLPRPGSAGESIKGLDLGALPGLRGFVLTYMKPGAEQVLSALYGAPLLAEWRYGLGKTAAFTSDLSGRWSRAWLAWAQFPRFAAQLVRWLERPSDNTLLHPRIDIAGGRASLTVDAYDSLGAFADGLRVDAILMRPGGERAEIPVPQTGPGLYEAGFPADAPGDYVITLSARAGDTLLAPLTIGASIPYSEEYRMRGGNEALLERLAAITGGRVISPADDAQGLAALLRREPGPAGTGGDAWRFLLLGTLLLFVLDIAARRLVMPRDFLRRLAARRGPARKEPTLSYDDLSGMVARAREEERAKLKRRVSGIAREGGLDPELAAYLYLARLRSRKAAREEAKR